MIHIRTATLNDLKSVHNIEVLCFNDGSYPLFVLRQLLDISNDYFLVAEQDDQILGYAIGNIVNGHAQSWILSLGVHPQARGKQVGKELTEKLIFLLEANNSKEICLTVHPDNASAIKIYQNLGFEIVQESDNYYLDNDARFVMKKVVNNRINS